MSSETADCVFLAVARLTRTGLPQISWEFISTSARSLSCSLANLQNPKFLDLPESGALMTCSALEVLEGRDGGHRLNGSRWSKRCTLIEEYQKALCDFLRSLNASQTTCSRRSSTDPERTQVKAYLCGTHRGIEPPESFLKHVISHFLGKVPHKERVVTGASNPLSAIGCPIKTKHLICA